MPAPTDAWLADGASRRADGRAAAEAPPAAPGRRAAAWCPAIVGGLLILLATWFLLSLFQPFKGEGEGAVRVVVPKGAGVGEIADLLAERDVISSPFFFEARATVSGRRGDLKPGSYTLKKDMSNGAALDALAEGPPPNIVTLTIPEGRSRPEIKRAIGDQLEGDYLAASKRSPRAEPARVRGGERARPRGLPVPSHLRAQAWRAGRRSWCASS